MYGRIGNGIAAAGVLVLLAAGASAQSLSEGLGAYEYANSCASCHGAGGEGDGPMVSYLTARPSDLTVLKRENGGVFPVSAVFATIEGTDGVGAHGTAEMPAWGQTFRMRVEVDPDFPPEARAAYAHARVLALVEYLASLQKD
jgi:mono/diheme cytochrome c family protein